MPSLGSSNRGPKIKPTTLGAVSLGMTFVFRTVDILGADFTSSREPCEGKVVTVVDFRPRYVNQIVVRDPSGYECLLP